MSRRQALQPAHYKLCWPGPPAQTKEEPAAVIREADPFPYEVQVERGFTTSAMRAWNNVE
jgi:hypothetical protein